MRCAALVVSQPSAACASQSPESALGIQALGSACLRLTKVHGPPSHPPRIRGLSINLLDLDIRNQFLGLWVWVRLMHVNNHLAVSEWKIWLREAKRWMYRRGHRCRRKARKARQQGPLQKLRGTRATIRRRALLGPRLRPHGDSQSQCLGDAELVRVLTGCEPCNRAD